MKHLQSPTNRSLNFDELVVEAVGDYLGELMKLGHIPHRQLDLVEEVLLEDGWDILRKVTYGHLSLDSYRQQLKDQKKERRTKGTA